VNRFVRTLATLGPAGYAPIAPATAGSALITGIGWFLPVPPFAVTLVLLAIGTAIAIVVAGLAEKEFGHDGKPIVIDEAVGQSLTLLFVPHVWWMFAAAFVLFRIFDVWKPLGAREVQVLPGGYGVVADDVIAGITACGVLHLGLWGLARMGIAR
jgi:phosphatidylglycerophosphatase A